MGTLWPAFIPIWLSVGIGVGIAVGIPTGVAARMHRCHKGLKGAAAQAHSTNAPHGLSTPSAGRSPKRPSLHLATPSSPLPVPMQVNRRSTHARPIVHMQRCPAVHSAGK